MNRFPFMAGASARGKNGLLPMRMNFPFSSFGLLLSTGQGIKMALPFSNASPEGSNPVLWVPIGISACVMCRMLSGGFYWLRKHRQRAEKFFSSPMARTTGWKRSVISLHRQWGSTAFRIRVPMQMIRGIACLSEVLSKFSKRPSLLNKDKAEEMIQEDWVCDITKAKTLLGFEPRVPLPEGARLTFEWYKKEKWL